MGCWDVRLEDLQKCRQLVGLARGLDRHGVGGDVDDLGPEQLGGLEDVRSGLGVGLDLDEHDLALDGRVGVELDDLQDVDQLVELLGDLLEGQSGRPPRRSSCGRRRDLGGADGERLDIEAASREQARHASQHPWLVLHQDGQRVSGHQSLPQSGAMDRARP